MTQPDLRTRTAEAPTPSPQFTSSLGDGSSPARTEVLQGSKLDTAAVSFAQERERVMQRSSHSKAVRQLRTALTAGAFVWASAALMDLLVARYAGDADLETLLANRAAGTLICMVALWRLWREPEPSVRVMRACDVLTYTGIAVCISLNTVNYRGLDSPYAAGILMVLLARGASTMAPWRQGALLFAPPALAYPVTLLVCSRFDARIAAQLRDPSAVGAFVCMLAMIALSLIVLVWTGHFTWHLAREAMETRNIGRYKLVRRIGSGGMGDVWAAVDVTLKQRVAIKTVQTQRLGHSGLTRLEREVRALRLDSAWARRSRPAPPTRT